MSKNSDLHGLPPARGLYRPEFEHDSCGVGFVCDIKGVAQPPDRRATPSTCYCRMDHRGACGCETNTGDGAGILTALPARVPCEGREARARRRAARARALRRRQRLPAARNQAEREHCKRVVEERIAEEGQELLGWRKVPIDPDGAGHRQGGARARCRHRATVHRRRERRRRRRVRAQAVPDSQERERTCCAATRRCVEREACSTSAACRARSSIYKGMLTPHQVFPYYPRPRRSRLRDRTWRWCIRGSRRTRSRRGTARSRCGS